MRFVDLPGIDDKIPTSLGNVRKKRPVLLRVDGLISPHAVMKIEQAGLPGDIQEALMRYLRSTPHAVDVHESLGRIRVGTKQRGRLQHGA